MDKKELQRQRMMTYFINAAKEIIAEEGISALSARKVGERAGYSYATIYNYFSDLNTLLFYCVFDFLEDAYRYLLSFKQEGIDAKQQLVTYSTEYFRYFADRPDTFRLVFIEAIGNPPEAIARDPQVSVASLLEEALIACVKEGYLEESNVQVVAEIIAASIHGKLLFLVQNRILEGADTEKIVGMLVNEIELLIKRKR